MGLTGTPLRAFCGWEISRFDDRQLDDRSALPIDWDGCYLVEL